MIFLRKTIIYLLCLFGTTVHASESRDQLLQIKAAAYQVSAAFSAYVFFEGAPRFQRQLNEAITEGSTLLAGNSVDKNIRSQWQKSILFIRENEQYVFAGEDRRLETSLNVLQNELYVLIDQELTKEDAATLKTPDYFYTRLKFEKVMAQYMGFASTSMGVFHSDESLEDSVNNFSAVLEHADKASPDYQKLIKKWNFIKKGMLNRDAPVTPFLTLHTAAEMRRLLTGLYNTQAQ